MHIASFAGFAPVNNPVISVAVIIDSPKGAYYGNEVSAPVFAEIAQEVLEYLGVPHDIDLRPETTASKKKLPSPKTKTQTRTKTCRRSTRPLTISPATILYVILRRIIGRQGAGLIGADRFRHSHFRSGREIRQPSPRIRLVCNTRNNQPSHLDNFYRHCRSKSASRAIAHRPFGA